MLLEREQTYYWRKRDKLVRPAELGGSMSVCEFIDILDGQKYSISMRDLELIGTEKKERSCENELDTQIDKLLAECDREMMEIQREMSRLNKSIFTEFSRPIKKPIHHGDIAAVIAIGVVIAGAFVLILSNT
jgi:hypothetical protein